MQGAVAAGHPATAAVGADILRAGGTAADAAVAASLASCVAESVMTGLLGGGHGLYHDSGSGETTMLDCFVAVPGLGGERPDAKPVELQIPFGSELVHYAIGAASFAVPGVPAGLGALWEAHGRLPWARLVEPALKLAADGVPMPPAHAACLEMLSAVMTMNDGARIYSPSGSPLKEGELLLQPGLVGALEAVAEEGPQTVYSGTLGRALLEMMDELGGLVTREDLEAYEAQWSEPVEVSFCGYRVRSRAGLGDFPRTLAGLEPTSGDGETAWALAAVEALARPAVAEAGTTNISVLDAEGNVCVLTTTLGLGSGDFVPGYDLHLNSMLGETDLLTETSGPGERMASMMSPAIALGDEGPTLAGGAAGGTRLRGALLHVFAGILDHGLEPQAAIDAPRLHPVGAVVHLEPGFANGTIEALASAGYEPRVWPTRHHYFGGVSAVTPNAAAGDPRRSGAGQVLP